MRNKNRLVRLELTRVFQEEEEHVQRSWGQRESESRAAGLGPGGLGWGKRVVEGRLRVGREKSWGKELVVDEAG